MQPAPRPCGRYGRRADAHHQRQNRRKPHEHHPGRPSLPINLSTAANCTAGTTALTGPYSLVAQFGTERAAVAVLPLSPRATHFAELIPRRSRSAAALHTLNSKSFRDTMKRFLASLSTISLIEVIGRHPAMAAGILSLLGVGGGAVISGLLTPPTLTPFISSNFNPNQSFGYTNNGLRLNGGTDGSMHPENAPNSAAFYGEMVINPNLSGSQGIEVPFNGAELNHNTVPGLPNLFFQRNYLNISNISWWLNPGQRLKLPGARQGGAATPGDFIPLPLQALGVHGRQLAFGRVVEYSSKLIPALVARCARVLFHSMPPRLLRTFLGQVRSRRQVQGSRYDLRRC